MRVVRVSHGEAPCGGCDLHPQDRAGVGSSDTGCAASGAGGQERSDYQAQSTPLPGRTGRPGRARGARATDAQPLAAAQLGPVAMEMVRGTLRSAAPVRADSVRRRTSSSSPAATSTITSSWTWSTRRLVSVVLLEVAVEPHQGQLEDVGRQPLDAGVHGLALGRLAHPVVRRVQVGQRPDPAELGAGGAPDLGVGHRRGPCTASPAGRRRSSSP